MRDIELENIFEEKNTLENVIFTISQNEFDSLYSTDFLKLDIENLRTDLLNRTYVSVKKIIFYENIDDIVDVNNSTECRNIKISSHDLQVLRENYGRDVVCDKQFNDETWICFCGAENNKNIDECSRCHCKSGGKHDDIKGSILQDKNRINEIIDEIVTKHTASGIYRYILSLEIEELNKLEYELKVLSHLENSLGENKKDKAVDIIIKMLC